MAEDVESRDKPVGGIHLKKIRSMFGKVAWLKLNYCALSTHFSPYVNKNLHKPIRNDRNCLHNSKSLMRSQTHESVEA